MKLVEYPFPRNLEYTSYCVFPDELERDDHVLFHATPSKNFESIVREGFQIPDPNAKEGLPSVTFAKRSSAALDHAMRRRDSQPGEYCIFAVRYSSLCHQHIKINSCDIHDYRLDPQPKIIGYCRIPATYLHL